MEETTEQPVKAEKPRGKCTGCAFEYQLTTIRSGELKGTQVIRKHNSRTGPGLCSGAYDVPEGAEDPYYCEQCEDDPDYCSEAPHGPSETDGPVSESSAPGQSKTPAGHCVQGRCVGCCGCSSMCTTDPCGQPEDAGLPVPVMSDVVGVAPGGTPIVAGPTDLVGAVTADPFTAPLKTSDQEDKPDPWTSTGTVLDRMTPEQRTEALGVSQAAYGAQAPDPFTAPAPASLIPESTTTVSGQPEPDRDGWGRYKIHGQAHTRATTFAKLGANTKAIEAWNERNVIRGLTLRPDLLMLANGLEVKRDRNDLNSIAAQAKDAAGSKVAANIGTAYHAFSERLDAGLMSVLDVPAQYQGRVVQYLNAVRGARLTTRPEWIERTTAVRADQIGAPLPVAGTLDRIFQLPDGSLVIGDLKTGSDLSYGEMEIEVQLALYAHGVNTHGLFDWNTKTWQPLQLFDFLPGSVKVRTDIAIVVHLPADGDGCTLYVADIERGWRDAQRLGPLQASLKEKNRFRTLTAADLAPRPATTQGVIDAVVAVGGPSSVWAEIPTPAVAAAMQQATAPVIEPPDSHWEHAKGLFSSAPSQHAIAELYQHALDSGRFHVDQLAVLVGLGKDRLNELARG